MHLLLQKKVVYLFSLLYFILFVFLIYLSDGVEGGYDSYNHYLISKFSWKHQHLFLDQWGKPIYTILTSIISQFGFKFLQIFNVIIILSTAILTYKTCKTLKFQYPIISFFSILLSALAIQNLISGLTEYLIAFLLALVIYLYLHHKKILAILIAGLLPFARSEGFVIMIPIGFYVIFFEKNPKLLLMLLIGPFIFNTLGWIIEGDPFWIISKNPYIGVELEKVNICGNGEFWQYIKQSKYIYGLIFSILFLAGAIISLLKSDILKKWNHNHLRFLFIVILGIWTAYVFTHSFIWWKGLMGSCGYPRVMIVVLPVFAIICNLGFETFSKILPSQWLINTFVICIILYSSIDTFKMNFKKFPMPLASEETEWKKVADWLKSEYQLKDKKLYFMNPYLNVYLDIDPYDRQLGDNFWGLDFENPPKNALLLWDTHFGPNEAKAPLEKIEANSKFKIIKIHHPNPIFETVNERDFEIRIYEVR